MHSRVVYRMAEVPVRQGWCASASGYECSNSNRVLCLCVCAGEVGCGVSQLAKPAAMGAAQRPRHASAAPSATLKAVQMHFPYLGSCEEQGWALLEAAFSIQQPA